MSNIVNIIYWVGVAVIGIVLMIMIIKDVLSYVKGSGDASIGKIATKVLTLIIMIALLTIARATVTGGGLTKLGCRTGDFIQNTVDTLENTTVTNNKSPF